MRNIKTVIVNYYLLAFLSPVISLITLLRSGHTKLVVPVGTFIMTILGSIYVYVPETDGETHRNTVVNYYLDMGIVEFLTAFLQLFFLNNESAPPGISDPYLHLLSFLSGSLFGVPELLHVFAAFVYGLIYFNILKILFERITLPKGISLIVLLFAVFLIYRGFSGLNSIRWWSGLWLMLYGFLGYWHYGRKKFIVFIFLALYIHFSFIAFVFPTLSAIWLYKKPKVIMLIWVGSFFIGTSYNLIKSYIPALNVIEQKERYTLDEEQLQRSAKGRLSLQPKNVRFYAAIGETSFQDYSIPLMIVFLYWIFKWISCSSRILIYQLFAAGVLLHAFGNLMEFSPTVSSRARAGSAPFIMLTGLLSLFSVYKNNLSVYQGFKIRAFMSLFFVSSLPVIIFHLSYILSIFSAFLIFLPGVSWVLGLDDLSIRDLLSILVK